MLVTQKRTLGLLVIALALASSTGCQSARYVLREPAQGVVAIPDNSNSWPSYNRKNAEKLMQEHFPEGYVVDREEEAVVGQTTNFSENSNGSIIPVGKKPMIGIGIGSTSGTATTVNATEYRLYYHRR